MREGGRWPTILEIVNGIDGLPRGFAEVCQVRINGELIPRERWAFVRPKLRQDMPVGVTLHMPLQGGGGQGKNILATVATIAVLLIASAVSAGALGLAGFSLLAAGTIGAQVAGAAIGLIGALAIAALTPPPKLSTDPGGATTDAEGKPASLTGNVLAPGAPVPRVLGTRRVFPPLAGQPLSELVVDDEVAEGIYVLSGPHALEDVRAGDAAVADMGLSVTTEIQLGLPESPRQTLVPRQSRTIAYGVTLSAHQSGAGGAIGDVRGVGFPIGSALPRWEPCTSRHSPDEIWLRLFWPEGLFQEASPATVMNVPVRVRIRRRGDSTWINLPEIHFSSSKPVPFQKDIRIKWATAPTAPNTPPTAGGPIYAFRHVAGQNGTTVIPATDNWTAHSSFYDGSGTNYLQASNVASSGLRNVELFVDKAVFYLSAATFPQDAQYEVQIKRGAPYQSSNFTASTYLYSTLVRDFFEYQIISGIPTLPMDLSTTHDKIILRHVSSIWNQNPIQSSDFATISVKTRGRPLEQISVRASGYVLDWTGAAWTNLTTTSNPAPHFRDVLIGNLAGDPMPEDMVGDLVDWRARCVTNGYTVNVVVDGRNADDVLNIIAACGRARPRMSEAWGVAEDRDRTAESPVQFFSPRNMRGFNFSRGFPQMPTSLRVKFDNIDNDYLEDEIIVDDPDVSVDQQQRIEQVRYEGVVEEDDARSFALKHLKEGNLRFVFYSGEVPIESIVAEKGDLVGVQHDVITASAGFARVLEVLYSSPATNVIGLRLDGTIPIVTQDMWSDPDAMWSDYSDQWIPARAGIAIRLKDQTSIVKEITAAAEESDEVSFVTPFAVPAGGALAEDCWVSSGLYGQEYSRMLVLDVQPSTSLTANVTFVPEAPELWD